MRSARFFGGINARVVRGRHHHIIAVCLRCVRNYKELSGSDMNPFYLWNIIYIVSSGSEKLLLYSSTNADFKCPNNPKCRSIDHSLCLVLTAVGNVVKGAC